MLRYKNLDINQALKKTLTKFKIYSLDFEPNLKRIF